MGNVACCKKPNEIIEDKDLLKKSTIKRDIHLGGNKETISNQENPFLETKSKEIPNTYINTNINTNYNTNNIDEENKIMDLEKNNIEHQSTIGPSDNLRKNNLNLKLNHKKI